MKRVARSIMLAGLVAVPVSGAATAEAQTLFALGETALLDFSGSLPGAIYYPPDSDEVYLHVSVSQRRLAVMRGGETIHRFPVAVGTGAYLRHRNAETGGWLFETPAGVYSVGRKETSPVWYAPDWFFVEKGLAVPPPDSPRRYFPGEMGQFALYLGDGLAIHGTKREESVGRAVSHGCMRLRKEDIATVYGVTGVGTKVIITP
jgi:lipoprotein-anchoring transpeptidase ErfK/SrfK